MPTPSKAHKAALIIQESAKIAAAAGIDYPFAEGEAVDAYCALNALAKKILENAPKGKGGHFLLGEVEAPPERQEGGE